MQQFPRPSNFFKALQHFIFPMPTEKEWHHTQERHKWHEYFSIILESYSWEQPISTTLVLPRFEKNSNSPSSLIKTNEHLSFLLSSTRSNFRDFKMATDITKINIYFCLLYYHTVQVRFWSPISGYFYYCHLPKTCLQQLD